MSLVITSAFEDAFFRMDGYALHSLLQMYGGSPILPDVSALMKKALSKRNLHFAMILLAFPPPPAAGPILKELIEDAPACVIDFILARLNPTVEDVVGDENYSPYIEALVEGNHYACAAIRNRHPVLNIELDVIIMHVQESSVLNNPAVSQGELRALFAKLRQEFPSRRLLVELFKLTVLCHDSVARELYRELTPADITDTDIEDIMLQLADDDERYPSEAGDRLDCLKLLHERELLTIPRLRHWYSLLAGTLPYAQFILTKFELTQVDLKCILDHATQETRPYIRGFVLRSQMLFSDSD